MAINACLRKLGPEVQLWSLGNVNSLIEVASSTGSTLAWVWCCSRWWSAKASKSIYESWEVGSTSPSKVAVEAAEAGPFCVNLQSSKYWSWKYKRLRSQIWVKSSQTGVKLDSHQIKSKKQVKLESNLRKIKSNWSQIWVKLESNLSQIEVKLESNRVKSEKNQVKLGSNLSQIWVKSKSIKSHIYVSESNLRKIKSN